MHWSHRSLGICQSNKSQPSGGLGAEAGGHAWREGCEYLKQGSGLFCDARQMVGMYLGDPGWGRWIRQNLDMDKGAQMTRTAFSSLLDRKWRKF